MPKLHSGCYVKRGFPTKLVLPDGNVLVYAFSGATRMGYFVEGHDSLFAKAMPGTQSVLWKKTWLQNQNEKEALHHLKNICFVPKVVARYENLSFINTFGQSDFMDVLIVTRLGDDLQTCARTFTAKEYGEAYCSAFRAIRAIAEEGLVVPDPHPHNVAVISQSDRRAVPCDLGECQRVSTKVLKSSLKKLVQGFDYELEKHYGIDFCTHPK